MLFGFIATVPESYTLRIKDVARMVQTALVRTEMQAKELAHLMDLSPSHLSRQLRDGMNLAQLANAGREFWRHAIKPLCDLVGLTREDVLEIFGADTAGEEQRRRDDAERDRRQQEAERRIDELERLVRRLVERQPETPAEDHQRIA